MTPEDVKKAYHAQQDILFCEAELGGMTRKYEDLRSYYLSHGWDPDNYLLRLDEGTHQRSVDSYKDRIRKDRDVIDPVLRWAETAPEDIQQIVRARVLDQMEWSEISLTVLGSGVPNTSYMRMKRYMLGEDPDPNH